MSDRAAFLCALLALSLLAGSSSLAGPPAAKQPPARGALPAMTIKVMVEATPDDGAALIMAEKLVAQLTARAEGRYAILGSAKSRGVGPGDLGEDFSSLCAKDKTCAELRKQVHQAFATCRQSKTGCDTLEPRLATLATAQKRVYAPLVASGKLVARARDCLSDEGCLQDLMASVQANHGLAIVWRAKGDEVSVSAKVLDILNMAMVGSCKVKGSSKDPDGLARQIAEALKL